MIDTNVYLSRWPARRLPLDETPQLVAALKTHGIQQAWAGSFDALQSAIGKLQESALGEPQRTAIASGNAGRLLNAGSP